jgi:predicted ABC-type ATPase
VAEPVLHVIAGPNGAGKTTFYLEVIAPTTHLDFVNADLIAADRWGPDAAAHAYDAAQLAAAERHRRMTARRSFVTETVFSHQSKVSLVREARDASYLINLHIVLVPEELAVARVVNRVEHGGHDVPEDEVRTWFEQLWTYLAQAIELAHEARIYDNTRAAHPFRLVATFDDGRLAYERGWPTWTPTELRTAGR